MSFLFALWRMNKINQSINDICRGSQIILTLLYADDTCVLLSQI